MTLGLALVVMCLTSIVAQNPARVGGPRPFEPAEELIYEAETSKAIFRRVGIADLRFTATRTPVAHPGEMAKAHDAAASVPYLLLFTGDVSSKGILSVFFKRFHQYVESSVEPLSFTVQKTTRLDEQGKRVRRSEAVFDSDSNKVVWEELDPNDPARQTRTASSEFSGQVQDVLSAIYYLRTRPLQVGNSFEIPISDSGKVYHVRMRVAEKCRIKTVLGRVEVVRVDPELFGPDKMINGSGKLSIWLTDDSQRIPVKARVKLEYGTFDIRLKKVKYTATQTDSLTIRD